MRSLAWKPIEFYSCFISYSSKNEEFAEHLHSDLQAKGVRCWYAPEHMKIGDEIRQRIDEAIRVHEKLMLVLSSDSIRSAWVKKEVETAFEREARERKTVLFPIRLDRAVMETDQAWAADIRRTRHIGDFTRWKDHDTYQNALDRLLRDLRTASQESGGR
jgi:predicted adenine nucleotide alpha hydrolase (AANH) superfamily ATPase